MFSKAKTFVKNHWKKAVYGGIAIQVATYGLRYAANKVIQYHEDQTKDMWVKMKKREHFERTNSNAVATFISLLPTLRETIENCLNSDVLAASLKEKSANKLEIWEEMKVIAFSRVLASIYGSTLLNVLLRIQLSVIGGYMIQNSVSDSSFGGLGGVDDSNGTVISNNQAIDAQLQHEYLSVANHFVQEGMKRICAFIYQQTKSVVGPMSLKRPLTVQDLEQIMWHIIDLIRNEEEGEEFPNVSVNPVQNSWHYIFPPEVLRRYNNFRNCGDPSYLPEEIEDIERQIVYETYDLLQSRDVASLLSSFETHGMSHFLDRIVDIIADIQNTQLIAQQASSRTSEDTGENSLESTGKGLNSSQNHRSTGPGDNSTSVSPNINVLQDVSIPLAKLIPILNSFAPDNLNESDPWIISTVQADTLRTFAANVYESFSSPIPVPL